MSTPKTNCHCCKGKLLQICSSLPPVVKSDLIGRKKRFLHGCFRLMWRKLGVLGSQHPLHLVQYFTKIKSDQIDLKTISIKRSWDALSTLCGWLAHFFSCSFVILCQSWDIVHFFCHFLAKKSKWLRFRCIRKALLDISLTRSIVRWNLKKPYFYTLKGFWTKEYNAILEKNVKVLYFFTILPLKAKMAHFQMRNSCTSTFVSGTYDSTIESQAMIYSR